MTSLRVRAPAKVNWTLEVLGKRSDGYHEIRSIMQTIDLCDTITLSPADEIALAITGEAGALAGPIAENLACRAAELLRGGSRRGVRIDLEKRIPIAAGLGGGSSDAAAVLRGLRALWELDIGDQELTSLAAELGSDVPFFVRGGTALASGRGDQIEPLPDLASQRLVVAWPPAAAPPDKTARMYAALRPEHYTDGSRTERLAEGVRQGEPVRDEDIDNVFQRVLANVDPEAARWLERANALGRPHLCGSGPVIFLLPQSPDAGEALASSLRQFGLEAAVTRTLGTEDASRPREPS